VWSIVGPRLANTLVLALVTMIVLVPVSFALGAGSAVLRDRFADHVTSTLSLFLMAIPEFVIGTILAIVLGVWISLLPPVSIINPEESIWSQSTMLVLPMLTLLAAALGQMIRMVRAAVLDVLHSDSVEMARLKGVPESRVIIVHALPNSLAATVQIIAFNAAYLIGGVVIVEAVFQYPGIGEGVVLSVSSRDLPTVLALGLMITGAYIVINLLADLIVIALNPRLRTG